MSTDAVLPPPPSPPWGTLPPIPGGWRLRCLTLGARQWELVLPAHPDAFLDDPSVLAANQRDDYMPYWPYLWPAAEVMARVLERAPWPAGTEVLEIGCGIGLVGLAGLARGWRVTVSDYDPTAVQCALLNARRNGLDAQAQGLVLDWRRPLPRTWPVILGCDVIYEPCNHPLLLNLLEGMLAPGGVCWLADPGRTHAARFFQAAEARGFRPRIMDETGRDCPFPSATQFQILVLRR